MAVSNPSIQPIKFAFNPRKGAAVAAYFVKRHGGRLNYLHAMKMAYTADRLALSKWGQPVIGGFYCAMAKGPVISEVLSLIKGEASAAISAPWKKHLRTSGFDLVLRDSPSMDVLSRAECDLLDTVYVMLGHRSRWDVVKWTHDEFGEWKDPIGSMKPIPVEEILTAVGKTVGEIQQIAKETAYFQQVDSILKRR